MLMRSFASVLPRPYCIVSSYEHNIQFTLQNVLGSFDKILVIVSYAAQRGRYVAAVVRARYCTTSLNHASERMSQ